VVKGQGRNLGQKKIERRFPVGSEITQEGLHFRVWAPRREKVSVVLEKIAQNRRKPKSFEMTPEEEGYFSALVRGAGPGSLYRFRLGDSERLYPDPASRFQPFGPDGPSQVVNPSAFQRTDHNWKGVHLKGGEVGQAVRSGRIQFMAQFRSFQDLKVPDLLPDPTAPETYDSHRHCRSDSRSYPVLDKMD